MLSLVSRRVATAGTTLGASSLRAAVVNTSSASSANSMLGSSRGYHDNIVEHYENPRNVGSFAKTDQFVGTGLVGAPACGDVMKLQIQVREVVRLCSQRSLVVHTGWLRLLALCCNLFSIYSKRCDVPIVVLCLTRGSLVGCSLSYLTRDVFLISLTTVFFVLFLLLSLFLFLLFFFLFRLIP
jgi:hypothetical protein